MSGGQDTPLPFPWSYLEETEAAGFESHWPTVLGMLKIEYADEVSTCQGCEAEANDLTWLPVTTSDESWARGSGSVGYVTVCWPCRRQVDFLREPILTEIERETREAGSSTFGVTWSENESSER